jgi:nitroreductase
MMDDTLATIVAAAGQAPSGDNTQPWRFVVDSEARTIALLEDATRDRSPMNAGRRMSRIAVGAALENVLEKARSLGWAVETDVAAYPALAVIRLEGRSGPACPNHDLESSRVTNRRVYDGRPVPTETLDRLIRETPELGGVSTHWIPAGDRIARLARLIGRGDAAMFGDASMRRAFLSKVRLDVAGGERVTAGLSASALELSAMDRLAIRAIRRMPDQWFKRLGVPRIFAAKARRLVASSSGLCLIAALDDREDTDLLAGRATQRAWLAMTRAGLAVQPMMSLLVLENVYENGDATTLDSLDRRILATLRDELRALVPEIAGSRPAFLMRFGYAPPPSGRTGRLPLRTITEFCTASSPNSRRYCGAMASSRLEVVP